MTKLDFAKIKADALDWLRARFEIPAVEWVPGIPKLGTACPIRVLSGAGYLDVWVGKSLIRYKTPEGVLVRVSLPRKVSLFPRWFDAGYMPELDSTIRRPVFGEAISTMRE